MMAGAQHARIAGCPGGAARSGRGASPRSALAARRTAITGFPGLSSRRVITVVITVLLAAFSLASPQAGAQETNEPAAPAERLHEALVSITERSDELDFQGRFEALAPVIDAAFDLPELARSAVGTRHWPKFSAEQREAFVAAYRRYTIATYADRFDSPGIGFEFRENHTTQADRHWVRYYILPPDDERVSIDYLVQKEQDEWRIVNVVSKGVSELALQRAQFDSIIKKSGIDALIEEVRNKADTLARPDN